MAPIDFSGASNNSLKAAIELCKQHNAVLHLMYVLENRYIVSTLQPSTHIPGIAKDLDEEARKRLYAKYESILKVRQLRVQIHLPMGIPFDEICKTATEMPVDLIVMGTHGAAGGKMNAVGTTCYNVIKNSVKVVFTIPINFEFIKLTKILFPVRPSYGIQEKYEFIKRLFGCAKAEIHIAKLSREEEKHVKVGNDEELFENKNCKADASISFTHHSYVCRNYSSKVLELTRSLGTDLIAINATYYYNWIEFFPGPYAQQIINHAKVPVLSFRQSMHMLENGSEKKQAIKMDNFRFASI